MECPGKIPSSFLQGRNHFAAVFKPAVPKQCIWILVAAAAGATSGGSTLLCGSIRYFGPPAWRMGMSPTGAECGRAAEQHVLMLSVQLLLRSSAGTMLVSNEIQPSYE